MDLPGEHQHQHQHEEAAAPVVANGAAPAAATWPAVLNPLPQQHFAGNPLDRTYDAKRKFDGGVGEAPEVCLVVVAGRELCVRTSEAEQQQQEGAEQELQVLLLSASDPQLDLNSDFMSFLWSPTDDYETAQRLPLYLLGQDAMARWTLALDISGPVKASFLEWLKTTCGLAVSLEDLRSIMSTLSRDACAMAGHAAALSQWHLAHRFCNRCGGPTIPTEAGLRRKCEREHKLYPRTDPVVIMLVESPDGQRALLGRSRKFVPGLYTCLSGFIDQCESIEEAVRREVREEARVVVADVHIIGSQPWPIGRYGSCELMLGCMAKAMSYEIMVNTGEMEDVQWYDRAELASAVNLFEALDMGSTVAEVQQQSMDTLGFFVPPPFAIAHHLIRLWAQNPGPWFPPVLAGPPPAVPAAAAAAADGEGDANGHAGEAAAAAAPAPVGEVQVASPRKSSL